MRRRDLIKILAGLPSLVPLAAAATSAFGGGPDSEWGRGRFPVLPQAAFVAAEAQQLPTESGYWFLPTQHAGYDGIGNTRVIAGKAAPGYVLVWSHQQKPAAIDLCQVVLLTP